MYDAMYRSGRELPGDVRRTDFPHPRQRERWKSDIMRFSRASPFDGSAREELEKGARQVKKTRCESEKEITQIALTTRSGSPLSE